MAHKTKLYRRAGTAGLIPFATVQIGNETYTDNRIILICTGFSSDHYTRLNTSTTTSSGVR